MLGKYFFSVILHSLDLVFRVTGISSKHPLDDRKRYSDSLNNQVCEKTDYNQRTRQFEEEQQKRHFESWETFWGRPGYGAPKNNTTKGNLMKMLHYPDKVSFQTFCLAL